MKTTLEMQNEIQKNFNFLELAEEYKGANEKILIRCNNCGYEWKAVPRSVKNSKYGCPKCGSLKNRYEKAKNNFVKKLDTSKYELLEYNSYKDVKVKCKKCGNIRHTTSSNILRFGCKECSLKEFGLKHRKTTETFIKEAQKIHGNKYDYSKTNYILDREPVIIICPEHGEFAQMPNKHLIGQGCPKCSGRNWTIEDFIKEARKVHGNKYDYSKVHFIPNQRNLQKVCIICPEHGEFWQDTRVHCNVGCGCPKCKQSHGEELVSRILESLNIKYESQVRVKDSISNSTFVLDFYIVYNNIEYIIEYNGRQHYEAVDQFGGEEAFIKQQQRDANLKNYCSNLNIKLLEISYKEDNQNIEFLIKKFLNLPSVNEKSNRLQQGNIGEGCDANTEITKETKESLVS